MATQRRKLIYGFGVNNADYLVSYRPDPEVRNVQVMCPYYKRWHGMMYRAFNKTCNYPSMASYLDTTVSEDYKYFMDFREWSIAQGMTPENRSLIHLDKDILVMGNNEYSKDKCAYVTQKINNLILTSEGKRGNTLLGVSYNPKHGNYKASITMNSEVCRLGTHKTEEEAHKIWQITKAYYIEDSVKNYEKESEEVGIIYRKDIVDSLLARCKMLRDAAESGGVINSL